jgi:hypothetical protein
MDIETQVKTVYPAPNRGQHLPEITSKQRHLIASGATHLLYIFINEAHCKMTTIQMAANGKMPVLDISSISLIHVNVGKRQLKNTGKHRLTWVKIKGGSPTLSAKKSGPPHPFVETNLTLLYLEP